ncbi:MAG: acetyl-CoA carboxylase carboxyltransferase subunit beta [Deltaproteobacteria bacterium]|nr:acetyl-CoA carboxylase carboxyltransferase subunit beta [Deltaproteobacteria bacterium]NIS76977.1 acetyl-CoA carboxylase carboxyltransferase subunit beta [Deltaproteobacteria bacterium]
MAIFKGRKKSMNEKKTRVPENLWIKCEKCLEIIYRKEVERNLNVCPKCKYHFRISVSQRIESLLEEGSFSEFGAEYQSEDILGFKDTRKYTERLKEASVKTGRNEAVITGTGRIWDIEIVLAVFDFSFLGGSMGCIVGDKVTIAMEEATRRRIPLVIVSASGGARMQEGTLSLMQMAKTCAALKKFDNEGLPYISILTDPTTGGVAASFAMLGDVIIAEPGALIGFAGPRVIEQTIKQKLPEGFQRAEFLLEHGTIDMIVDRTQLKQTVYDLFKYMHSNKREKGEQNPSPSSQR